MKLARSFSISKGSVWKDGLFVGLVVLSEEQIYLSPIGRGGMLGGLVGGLIAGAIESRLMKKRNENIVELGRLAAEVKSHPVWGKAADDTKVIVIPRECVQSVRCSMWTGVKIVADGGTYSFPYSFLKVRSLKEQFRKWKWPVE